MPPYQEWSETCDTLHALTQLLGKLAVALAPAEPQLQHAALRLSARGWETAPLPSPDGSGTLVVVLDLHDDAVAVETSGGRVPTDLPPAGPIGRVGHPGGPRRRRRPGRPGHDQPGTPRGPLDRPPRR